MKKIEVTGLFTLAEIPILRMWELANGYWPGDSSCPEDDIILKYALLRTRSPWWLVKTPVGCVEIGYRKKVYEIDWTDTPVRAIVTKDDVTKDKHFVHAWKIEHALIYLRSWWTIADIFHRTDKATDEFTGLHSTGHVDYDPISRIPK